MKKLGGMTVDEIQKMRMAGYQIECTTCHELKHSKHFSYGKNKSNGLCYIGFECNQCGYKRKIEKHGHKCGSYNATQLHKQRHTIDGRAAYLLYGVKRRCVSSGMQCEISKKFIVDKLSNGVCEATGIKLDLDGILYKPYAPSLDRINSDLGYTEDNVQMVCMIYNFCKNKFTSEQVEKFLKDAKI